MKTFQALLLLSSFILLPSSFVRAQSPYDVGDWTSFKDFRYARAIDGDAQELFIATSGGILEYRLFRKTWDDPWVVGYGLSQAVQIDDPVLILLDDQTGYLWVATRTQLLRYQIDEQRWTIAEKNLWGPGQRVVNIGVGGNNIYVETVPEQLYNQFFQVGSPLPLTTWPSFATRYKGARSFGGFMQDIEGLPADNIRWRGFRSKVPLNTADLQGGLGLPPVNFPSLLLPAGWIWRADGVMLDQYMRPAPVTDWFVDRFGYLWATFWGTGFIHADLRSNQTDIIESGPAGNDLHSILLSGDDTWLAGFNSGDRKGITLASADLKSWQSFETRDNIRIQSTVVYDMADFDGLTWFATDEGLLSFTKRAGEWKAFRTSEDLQANEVRALAVTDTALWIGNVHGLCYLSRPSHLIFRVPNQGIELAGVTDLGVCGDTMYVGTTQGLFKGSMRTHGFAFMPVDPGLLNAPVSEISVSGSDVWLVTDQGVEVYHQSSGESKSWLAQTWMHDAEPSSIYAGSKFVWVGTEKDGFYRFNPKSGEWISYTTADGLLDNHVQIMREDGDDLLIGTLTGLTRFYWNRPNRAR